MHASRATYKKQRKPCRLTSYDLYRPVRARPKSVQAARTAGPCRNRLQRPLHTMDVVASRSLFARMTLVPFASRV